MEPSPSAELSFAPVVQIGLVNFHFGKFSVFGDPKVDVTIGAASTPHPARPGDGSDGTRHAGVSFPPKVLETEFGKMQTHQFVAPSGNGSYKIERGFVPSSVNWQQLSQTAWRDLELPNKTLARVYTLGSARLIARTKPIAFAEDEPLSTGQYLVVTIDDPQRGQEHFILLHAPSSKSQCSEPAEADRLLEADGRQFILDWPPHRLGDGSYGAVFKVHDRSRMPYALKVLYERQFLTRTGLMSIRTSDLAHLEGERPAPASDDVIQIPFDEVVNLLLSAMARASEGDPFPFARTA